MDKGKIQQHRQLHADDRHFGTTALLQIPACVHLILLRKPVSILDYGCGKGILAGKLRKLFPQIRIDGYDPAVPAFSSRADLCQAYDLIFNFDVLEHIPEEEIPGVLADMRSFGGHAFFHLSHVKASHVLPDGTNAHCTVQPPQWYQNVIARAFEDTVPVTGRSFKESHMLTFRLSNEEMAQLRQTVFAGKKCGEAIALFFAKWIPLRRWRKAVCAGLRERMVCRQTQDVFERLQQN